MEPKALWRIFVPAAYGVNYHRQWDDRVLKIAGGLTIFKAARGDWIDPNGRVYAEQMIPVEIACTRDQIVRIAAMTKDHYKQEVVMVYKVSSEVLFYGSKET